LYKWRNRFLKGGKQELGFNTQNLSLGFIHRLASIREKLFGLIHVIHIEKLSEGNRNEKMAFDQRLSGGYCLR